MKSILMRWGFPLLLLLGIGAGVYQIVNSEEFEERVTVSKSTAPAVKDDSATMVASHLVGQRVYSARYWPLGTVASVTKGGEIHVVSNGPMIWGTRVVKKHEAEEGTLGVILTISRGEFRGRPNVAVK